MIQIKYRYRELEKASKNDHRKSGYRIVPISYLDRECSTKVLERQNLGFDKSYDHHRHLDAASAHEGNLSSIFDNFYLRLGFKIYSKNLEHRNKAKLENFQSQFASQ